MKVLVTGAAGFVGSRLCRTLAAAGHKVLALVHPDSRARAAQALRIADLDILAADLSGLQATQLPDRVDAVVTLAQARRFREFPDTAHDTFAVNVRALLTILHWAISAGVQRIVHVSSGGVYGGNTGAALRETDPIAVHVPLGFYLSTKLCAELLFQNYATRFATAVTLRPFFIYGPEQRSDMFVARLLESVRSGTPIEMQGADGLRVNPVFVDDVTAAIARALDLQGSHLVNVAGAEVVTLRQLAERIGEVVGRAPVYKSKDGAPAHYVADITQQIAKLGAPQIRLGDGLQRASRG